MAVDVVELDAVELVTVELFVQVVRYANQRNHMHPVFCVMRSGLRASSAGQAVGFESRSTHSQSPQDPLDDVALVDTLMVVEVVE